MGFLDDILAQQSGGGLLGGLPATWQYTNPADLTPAARDMMALVGTQNPEKAGFNPLPPNTAAFPAGGVAPLPGMVPDNAVPVTPFDAGASPVLFANPAGSTPGNPALPNPLGDGADAPASPIKVGNVMMPRVGTEAAFTPDPAALPVNAQSAQGQGLPVAPAAAPSIGDNLMTGYQNMRHGGGLLGSIVAAVTGKRNDPQAVVQQQQTQIANMTARALVNKGIAPELAIAAVQPGNTEFLKTLITQAFGPKTVQSLGEGYVADKDGNIRRAYTPDTKDNFSTVQTGEDGMGGKTFQKLNKATGEMTPIEGSGSGGGGGLGDMTKTGAEYLATIPPKHQAIVKGMVDGTIQPPTSFAASKPYWQTMLAAAKNLDPNFNMNNWASRHKLSTDLASSGNSSMGGILSNGESSFKHLAEYTKSAADLGNVSYNFRGGGTLAHGVNYVANSGGGSNVQGKLKAIKDNLGHYGQESTKFYAGTGGGVEERMHALKEMDPTTTSGEEAAAYAEKEMGLMTDRLFSKLKEIKDIYGEEQGNRIIAKKMPEIEHNMAVIKANIAKLRGEATTNQPAAPSTLKVGESATVDGVTIKKVGQ